MTAPPPDVTTAPLPALETPRLRLRPFTAADEDALYTLYGDPSVMAIRKIGTQTRAQSRAQLREIVDHWAARGFGLWAVTARDGGGFLGECGLRHLAPGSPLIELSYGLLPAYWGQGLASEAARAALDYGFEVIGLTRVHGLARADNAASRRVMEKLGLRFEREERGANEPVVRYVVARGDWRARRR